MERLWAPWRMQYIKSAAEDKDQTCIFCTKPKTNNDKENLIVYRSRLSFIILNKFPYNNGHLMVVPYEHKPDIIELDDETILDLNNNIKKSIVALKNTINPHGFNIGINMGRTAGAGIIDHVHYHIVPRWNGDTNYMPVLTGTKVISEALDKTWEKLWQEFYKEKK